mmetsp:Transcript_19729/g.54805  ORF Transcript_19729/g.54805 Transcript_19729/m.54805 type:complete len:380 (+) Transcript_19729:766-1905(+)
MAARPCLRRASGVAGPHVLLDAGCDGAIHLPLLAPAKLLCLIQGVGDPGNRLALHGALEGLQLGGNFCHAALLQLRIKTAVELLHKGGPTLLDGLEGRLNTGREGLFPVRGDRPVDGLRHQLVHVESENTVTAGVGLVGSPLHAALPRLPAPSLHRCHYLLGGSLSSQQELSANEGCKGGLDSQVKLLQQLLRAPADPGADGLCEGLLDTTQELCILAAVIGSNGVDGITEVDDGLRVCANGRPPLLEGRVVNIAGEGRDLRSLDIGPHLGFAVGLADATEFLKIHATDCEYRQVELGSQFLTVHSRTAHPLHLLKTVKKVLLDALLGELVALGGTFVDGGALGEPKVLCNLCLQEVVRLCSNEDHGAVLPVHQDLAAE